METSFTKFSNDSAKRNFSLTTRDGNHEPGGPALLCGHNFSLTTRDGNLFYIITSSVVTIEFQPNYKGWKLYRVWIGAPSSWNFSLTTRDGNL